MPEVPAIAVVTPESPPATETENHESRITFLYQAIADIQGTIRAVDAKVAALLVVLALPFSAADTMKEVLSPLYEKHPSTFMVLALGVAIGWVASVFVALRCLSSIDDPTPHVPREKAKDAKGAFYSGGLFELSWRDALLNRGVQSARGLTKQLEVLPRDDGEVAKELAFEQLKLAYIRDMKILRQRWAFRSATFCIAAALLFGLLRWWPE